jgi:hypothetical protein
MIENYFSALKKKYLTKFVHIYRIKKSYKKIKQILALKIKQSSILLKKKDTQHYTERLNRVYSNEEKKNIDITDNSITIYDLYRRLNKKNWVQYAFNIIKEPNLKKKTESYWGISTQAKKKAIKWKSSFKEQIEKTCITTNFVDTFLANINEKHWAFKYLMCQFNLQTNLKLVDQTNPIRIKSIIKNHHSTMTPETIISAAKAESMEEEKIRDYELSNGKNEQLQKIYLETERNATRSNGVKHVINVLQKIIDPKYSTSEKKIIEDEMVQQYKSEEEDSDQVKLVYQYQDQYNSLSFELMTIDLIDSDEINYLNIEAKKSDALITSWANKNIDKKNIPEIHSTKNKKSEPVKKPDQPAIDKRNEELRIEEQNDILQNENSKSLLKYVEALDGNVSTSEDVNTYFEHYEGLEIEDAQAHVLNNDQKEKLINLDTDYDSLDTESNLDAIEIENESLVKQTFVAKTSDESNTNIETTFLEAQISNNNEIYDYEMEYSSQQEINELPKSKWYICYKRTSVERAEEKMLKKKELFSIPFYTKKYFLENKWFLEYNIFQETTPIYNTIYKNIIMSEIYNYVELNDKKMNAIESNIIEYLKTKKYIFSKSQINDTISNELILQSIIYLKQHWITTDAIENKINTNYECTKSVLINDTTKYLINWTKKHEIHTSLDNNMNINRYIHNKAKVEFQIDESSIINNTSFYILTKKDNIYRKVWDSIKNIYNEFYWEINDDYFNDWINMNEHIDLQNDGQVLELDDHDHQNKNDEDQLYGITNSSAYTQMENSSIQWPNSINGYVNIHLDTDKLEISTKSTSSIDSSNTYLWGQSLMYQDIYVRKFINFFMRNGKKETAYKIFYSVLLKIKDITGLPAIKYIKTLFTSTTNYFSYSQIMLKNKTTNKMSFFNRKKRKYYLYHLFFKELKDIYISEYVSIVDKISYLILKNMYDAKTCQWEDSFDTQIEEIYKERHSFLQTSVRKSMDTKAIPYTILNYKKKY